MNGLEGFIRLKQFYAAKPAKIACEFLPERITSKLDRGIRSGFFSSRIITVVKLIQFDCEML